MLNIYKASAGSGKTFQIVLEYLKLVFADAINFRRILAVTFTNKATAEMKTRILDQLYKLSNNYDSKYRLHLIKHTGLSANEINRLAANILRKILYNYDSFSVSTIDKFTQGIIKSFNREIGISPDYMVELDNEILLFEAVDRLINEAGNNAGLMEWLVRLAEEKIMNSQNFNIENDLFEIGKELFVEKFQNLSTQNGLELPDKPTLKELQKELNQIAAVFEKSVTNLAKQALETISLEGLCPDDFIRGTTGPVGYFLNLAAKKITKPRVTDFGSLESSEKWFTRKSAKKETIRKLADQKLIPIMREIIEFFSERQEKYYSAIEARKNLYTFGVLIDLKAKLDQIRYEKDILPIADANIFMNKIIEGCDSPFIYEKTGNRYFHYLLDEFQDTSVLQWENFIPLIKNSLSYNKLNLVVGDVKQSIYRWRNSDWKIFASAIHTDLPGKQTETIVLQHNWRSRLNIIEFNNLVFPQFLDILSEKINKDLAGIRLPSVETWIALLRKSYSDVIQIPAEKSEKRGGCVVINQSTDTEGQNYEGITLRLLLDQIKALQDKGFPLSETAILVRKKIEGAKIVDYFLQAAQLEENKNYNLTVFSNESLFLVNSKAVQFIILIMKHFVDRENRLLYAAILQVYFGYLKPELEPDGLGNSPVPTFSCNTGQWILSPEFDKDFVNLIKPAIDKLYNGLQNNSIDEVIIKISTAFSLFLIKSELPYIQALIDKASELKLTTVNDFSGFIAWWDEKGSDISVTFNETANAIRLLTIHSAKGLEFEAVLIPFFNWSVSHMYNNPPILWCKCDVPPFNSLNLIPVRFRRQLLETCFSNDYVEEYISNLIDNLNLVYVAFTRAKSALFITVPGKNKSDSIGSLLSDAIPLLTNSIMKDYVTFQCFNKWSYGDLEYADAHKNEQSVSSEMITSARYYFNDFAGKLKFRNNSKDFIIGQETGKSAKNLGRILHEILSGIKLKSEVEPAIKKAYCEKRITYAESQQLLGWLNDLIASDEAGTWFSGEYKVYNERSILTETGVYRPDRLMITGRRAIVVDYKIGEAESFLHAEQVKKYSEELKNAGLDAVSGYLWYLRKNRIEKICDF